MGFILRRSDNLTNPTLPGGVYGLYITAGRGVFWYFDGVRVRFVLFISDGGRYGMDSSALRLSYKGVDIVPADFKFHPGTLTKQINPFIIESVNDSTNRFTLTNHIYNDGDQIRLGARLGGALPAGTTPDNKYFVVSKTVNTFQISQTSGGAAVDLTDAGSGTLMVWLATAGWDDPVQGLPEFCPQTKTTFSGICYVEGKIPANYTDNQEPDWQDFRVEGLGRKLMNYGDAGGELGIISGSDLLKNPALALADCQIVEYGKSPARLDFVSLNQLKSASPELVWQRTDTDDPGTGALGSYYNGSGNPPDVNTGNLYITRRDGAVEFSWGDEGPFVGSLYPYYAVWEFGLLSKFTESYTLSLVHNGGVRMYVDDVLKIDQWVSSSNGTHTTTENLNKTVLKKIRIEFFATAAPGAISFKWQSASQALEIVPKNQMYDPDLQIPRYEANLAAATPVEASEYFERIMKRCPGWDWTDANGKITFLPPTRPVVYEFSYDAEEPSAPATFLDKTFQKKLRHRRDRRNFEIYSFRNRKLIGFPEQFVEVNRPRLRELGNGMPNNDSPEDLQVLFENQAQRIADLDFKLSSDPKYLISLDAQKQSAVVTKSRFVRVRNWVKGDLRVEDSICLATGVNRQGNRIEFSFLPIENPFYMDEPVITEGSGESE